MSASTIPATGSLNDDLARAALAGASTGGRTFTALAALAVTARTDAPAQPDAFLAKTWVKGLLSLFAVQELVMDKLPQTPSRLTVAGLPGRIVAAGLCGAIIARRQRGLPADDPLADPVAGAADPLGPPAGSPADDMRVRTVACVGAAVGSAVGAAWLGVKCRGIGSDRLGHDWPVAGVEDAAVIAAAAAVVR